MAGSSCDRVEAFPLVSLLSASMVDPSRSQANKASNTRDRNRQPTSVRMNSSTAPELDKVLAYLRESDVLVLAQPHDLAAALLISWPPMASGLLAGIHATGPR